MSSGSYLMRNISIVLCFSSTSEMTHMTHKEKRSEQTCLLASRKKWNVCSYHMYQLLKNLHAHSFWCKSCVSNSLGLWHHRPHWHKRVVNRFISGETLLTSVDVLVYTCSSPAMPSVCSLAVAYLKLLLSAWSNSQGLTRIVCSSVTKFVELFDFYYKFDAESPRSLASVGWAARSKVLINVTPFL